MAINSNVEKTSLATKYSTDAVSIALCTGDPGALGTTTISNELTGGSPAYARVVPSWGTVTNGVVSCTPTFNVGTGNTVSWVCLFNAGGVAIDKSPLATPQTFASQGTYTPTVTFTES